MKVCKLSSTRIQRTESSGNKNAQKSSGSEIHNDNLQVGFINTAITMGANDEAGYMSLQREAAGYQTLNPPIQLEVLNSPGLLPPPECSIEPEDNSGYTIPQTQSSQNILDKVAESENTVAQAQPRIYEEIPDFAVAKETGSGCLHPLSQSDGDQSCGYVPITEYSGTVPPPSCRITKQEESMQSEDKSGDTPPKSQPCGYVPITEYSDAHPPPAHRIAEREESMQGEEKSGNTSPESQPYGYVPITEYSDILPPLPQRMVKQAESM